MFSKAISPMIATVLLIAFTVAVGGILSLWLTSLTSTQTSTTGASAEKQILCARSVLRVTEVVFRGSSPTANITVVYEYGTENLYNFTIAFVDSNRKSYTVNRTALSPQYNNTAGQMFAPGMLQTWNLNISTISGDATVLTATSLQDLKVVALCQSTYPVMGECKAGQSCMA